MFPVRPEARDTSMVAERLQFECWGRMSPQQKFATFLDLQDSVVAMAESGIRFRHLAADDREVFLRRVSRTLDRATMIKVYDWDPDLHR